MPTLEQYFKSDAAIEVSGRPVTFRAIRRTDSVLAAEVRALLFFVDEATRAQAHRDADRALNSKLTPGEVPTEAARSDERAFQVLFHALRNVDPPHAPLLRTVDELRGCLTLPAAQELWAEYNRYLGEEFPDYVDPEQFAKLVEQAKKKPLPALLADFDFDLLKRSMVSLGNLLLQPATPK